MTGSRPTQRESKLEQREREMVDLGKWLGKKMDYHKKAAKTAVKAKQILQGEIWDCDYGFNIGAEKNKERMVVVISNNSLNRMGKVVVLPITDAKNKIDVALRLPNKTNNYLLYTTSTNPFHWYDQGRTLPSSAIQYSWLRKDSIISCEEPRSMSKARFGSQKKGDLNPVDLEGLKKKIAEAFSIEVKENTE
ncbi:type II toxin-antitoxin system PemK/MazF family toxin [Streptomyces fungicidicus]|uniref:type II toxin-antitoxin system PemK/MazF family toxin n=1 Tax=Streptomyces fungicidicus TaxID=68203 RepID=UPI0034044CBA